MDLSELGGSSLFQLGYPILNSLLAASGRRGYQAASGLNIGLGVANHLAEQQKADEQNKLLGQSLGSVLKSTTPVTSTQKVAEMGVDPKTASFEMPPPDQNAALPPPVTLQNQTTTTQKPNFSPQAQSLGDALINAKRPDLILPIIARQLFKEPTAPHTFGSPETGYYNLNQDTGQANPLVPGVGRREPTPPRPVVSEYGTMIPTRNAQGQYEWPAAPTPALAPPARQLSPQDQRLKDLQATTEEGKPALQRSQIGAHNAQAGSASAERDLRQQTLRDRKLAADAINNPNASKDKITTAISVLVRQNEGYARMPPEEGTDEFADWQTVKRMLRGANARLDKMGGYGATTPPAGGGGGDVMASMPPAAQHNGKIIKDTQTGKRYKSNGTQWVPIQ